MPRETRERLGSVNYYGYDGVSEAFYDLDEQAQAIYMTLIVKRFGAYKQDPVVMVDLAAYGAALKMTTMDVYKSLAAMTGQVVRHQLEGGGKLYTNLAVSIEEEFDLEGQPVSVVLMVPILEDHTSLVEQLEDLAIVPGVQA